MNDLIVSVIMLAYNHEPYIAKALDSILMQKTNFEFEVVIGEDCSTDGTRKIIENYEIRYPHIIKPIYQPINIGMMRNYLITQKSCRGKYIASCEGDDFWTNENKLQYQVDFLDKNSFYSGVCHELLIIKEGEPSVSPRFYSNIHKEHSFFTKDLIQSSVNCPIGTASLMFRQAALEDQLDDEFAQLPFGDKPVECLISCSGPIKYFPLVMGVYRQHSGGFTHKFNWPSFEKEYETFYHYINKKLNYKYDSLIKKQLIYIYQLAANQYFGSKNYIQFLESFQKMNNLISFTDLFSWQLFKTYLKRFYLILAF